MYYDKAKILKTEGGKRYYSSIFYPLVSPKEDDLYITTRVGDRLDILAEKYLNDSKMWRIIASVNNISKDSIYIKPGTQLRIPGNLREYLDSFRKINNNR